MNAKRVAVVVLLLALLGFGLVGYSRWHQRQLSDDMKRLLIAANDYHTTEADRQQYEAQARPLVRTQRDKEVFAEYEDAMSLFADMQLETQHFMADNIYEHTADITNEPDKAEHLAAIRARRERVALMESKVRTKLNDVRQAIALPPLPKW